MHGATAEEKEPSRRFIQAVKDLSAQYQKPVALQYNTEEEELAYIKRALGYPIFAEPEDALMALAISRDHYRKQNALKEKPPSFPVEQNQVRRLLEKARKEKRDLLLPEALGVLQAYGIPVADYQVAQGKGDLKKAMEKLGKPVALKVVSPEISHKSDVGGVVLNLNDFSEAEKAYDKMNRLNQGKVAGVIVQRMVPDGREIILGAKRDPSFGPVVLFGLGGIFVEILKETSLRVSPINRFEAEEMISEIRGSDIFKGLRGEKPLDTEAVVESLLRLSQLVADFPEIEGIDINPLKVLEKGAVAVDARIVLKTA
jgi:acetyltransferase